jgi:cell wall-associated NlpC family hydrolase
MVSAHSRSLPPGAIIAAARAYLGVPWVHQGVSAAGVDCLGLVVATARDLGVPTPPLPPYGREPDILALRAGLGNWLHKASTREPEPGDVLLFHDRRYPGHLGLMSEAGRFIHAWNTPSVRRVCEVTLNGVWRDRLDPAGGVYRFA